MSLGKLYAILVGEGGEILKTGEEVVERESGVAVCVRVDRF